MKQNIAKIIKEIRERAERTNKRGLIGAWREKDRLNGKIVDSFVIIFRTRGCRWAQVSGCSMCGYYNDTSPDITNEDLVKQLESSLEKYNGEKLVKIYTSGSFLDDGEIPKKIQKKIIESYESSDRIIIESRPEFVNGKIEFLKNYENIMVALGLESANDETLIYRINKGFRVKDYVNAAKILNENAIPVKTYILLKPPFMSEKMAIEESIYSINFASNYSEIISLNPMNIQRYTLVEYLWKRGEYRAPWLWSVVEILKRTHNLKNEIVSYPTAGGKIRGAHNCGKCDSEVLKAIYDFSLTQDIGKIENLNCECRERWMKIIEYEDFLWDYTVNR